ncbi:hypothetical protein D3C86_1645200 [compost metagenome]
MLPRFSVCVKIGSFSGSNIGWLRCWPAGLPAASRSTVSSAPSPQMLAKLRGREGRTTMLQHPAVAVISSTNCRVFRSTTVTEAAGVAFCTNSSPPSVLCCR